jgi:uncharacterized protein YlxP (DUF503 family)
MYSACFSVTFTIPGAFSLKDKRMVVKSIQERCKSRFNVSVVECGENDKWQLCSMGFALAAISASQAQQNMQTIIDYLYDDGRIEITGIESY